MAANFPKLIITTGPEEGKEFDLSTGESFLVGRSDENDIILDDSSLSRRHASIHQKEGVWFIRDEGSRNGTIVNSTALTPAMTTPLTHLDVIRLGIYEMRFATQSFTNDEVKNFKPAEKAVTPPTLPTNEIATNKNSKNQSEPQTDLLDNPLTTDHQELKEDQKQLLPENHLEEKQKTGKSLLVFTLIALFFCVIGLVIFFSYHRSQNTSQDQDPGAQETSETEEVTQEDPPSDQLPPPEEAQTKPDTPPADTNAVQQNISEALTTVPKTQGPLQTAAGKQSENLPIPTDDGAEKAANNDAQTSPNVPTQQDDSFTTTPVSTVTEQPSTALREFTVLLDIKTEPYPATIYFKGERLCTAPCRQQASVNANDTYTLAADYDLRELNDIYRKKVEFTVKPNTDVLELTIKAEIGQLKVSKLPMRIEFYLEGYYDYDQLKANPAKINDVAYGKSIYLPYGKYVVELREKTQIAGSQNTITQIRFQREYTINQDNPTIDLNVTDRDLQFFPANIKSDPPGAEVFYSDEKMGNTPFSGLLPLGPHQIKLIKEGFFPTIIDIDMRMNSVYETTVTLKTSKMGELINEAREQIRNAQWPNALDTLVNALKFGGSIKEKSEVYFLLGSVHNNQKSFDQAVPYLERAKENPDYYTQAALELVRSYHGLTKDIEALKLIVEVLANLRPETSADLRKEANNVFRLISPVKSVIYIYTEPEGAKVFINDKIIEQASPLILSDLGLGNYRIQIEKSGYQTYKTNQNLKIGEFVLIKVRLTPEQL
ncbi:MAG: FHA protein [uncultured bacterium]|nr:MAG: FHA protein [uncultured bacterium]